MAAPQLSNPSAAQPPRGGEPDGGAGVQVIGVSKRFGVTQALDGVSVSFLPGEVHALVGENGAGKSTLGKIIAGLHRQDSGSVLIDGGALPPGSIDDAYRRGVRIVHQELAQCPSLSVAENLCLHELPRGRFGTVRYRETTRRAGRLLARLDDGIDVAAPLGSLPPGRRQIVQIASALDEDQRGRSSARVIVFDEPTSSLSVAETERLLTIVRRLRDQGLTVIYVSHRMGEIFACCDRATVLRDGRFVATTPVAELDEQMLIEQMIGRRIEPVFRRAGPGPGREDDRPDPTEGEEAEAAAIRVIAEGTRAANGKTAEQQSGEAGAPPPRPALALQAQSISSPGLLRDVTFQVRPGEVLGLGGLVGAGRSELLDAVFGLDRRATGRIEVFGRRLPTGRPPEAIRSGVGYVPEDRRLQGLFLQLGVDENIVMPFMRRLAHVAGVRSRGRETRLVRDKVEALRIKSASLSAPPDTLSGGNQQKLLIARWLGADTRVLLLDEPTRGIDVGTKAEIYRLIHKAAEAGTAIVLVSSEMPELLALSDRIAVLCRGRITGELTGKDMTQSNILRLATREP